MHEPSINIKTNIKITSIPLSATAETDKFNSNNHHALGVTYDHVLSEEEYSFYKAQSARDKWAHLQPTPGVIEHTFARNQMSVLRDAAVSGVLTGRRPLTLKEDLDDLEATLPNIAEPNKYFARLSECSPKDGVGGCGPFSSRALVLDALVTSHRCLKTYLHDKTATLYLVPWRADWHQEGSVEFRVFCYHGKTTAITQYNWMKDVGLSNYLQELEAACQSIIVFCEQNIIPQLSTATQGNWTIDVIYNFLSKCTELVEVNSFGCELAAGSGLFHWVADMDVMYGRKDFVEVRFVSP